MYFFFFSKKKKNQLSVKLRCVSHPWAFPMLTDQIRSSTGSGAQTAKGCWAVKDAEHLTPGCLLLESSRQLGSPDWVLSCCSSFLWSLFVDSSEYLPTPPSPGPRPRTLAIDINDPPAANLICRAPMSLSPGPESRASAILKVFNTHNTPEEGRADFLKRARK